MFTMIKRRLPVMLALLLFATLLVSCLACPLDTIPDSLIGTWQGESTVRLPIVFVPDPDDDHRR